MGNETQAPAAATGTVEVRVLVDHPIDADTKLLSNTVATLDAKTAAALKKQGIVDDEPEGIAAARKEMARIEARKAAGLY